MTLSSEPEPGRGLPPRPPVPPAAPPVDRPRGAGYEEPPGGTVAPAGGTVAPVEGSGAHTGIGSTPAPIGEPVAGEARPLSDLTGTEKTRPARQPFTRIRAAWVGVWAGILVVILLIVFIGQNTAPVDIHFLWLDGQIPTALALLIAGVGGAIIALATGAARILQLRRMMRR
jgi:uncharacterized integral membrane protein